MHAIKRVRTLIGICAKSDAERNYRVKHFIISWRVLTSLFELNKFTVITI